MMYWAETAEKRRAEGYLTVFLALCIPIFLSLIFVLLDGARRNAVRMQTELAVDTAVNSALAEYSRELFLQYDLLMIDTSYGSGNPSVQATKQHIWNYLEKNLSSEGLKSFGGADFTGTSVKDLQLSGTRLATDLNGQAVREQVHAYLSAEPVEAWALGFLEAVNGYNGFGFDTTEWARRKAQNEEELRNGLEEARRHRKESEEDGKSEEETETEMKAAGASSYAVENGVDEEHAMDPWKEVNVMCQAPILTVVLGEGGNISAESVRAEDYVSHRAIQTGDEATAENSHHYSEADALSMNEYIHEKCGNFQKTMEKSRLKYQMEYLLCGKNSDRENLEKTAETLLLIRLAANTAYLFSDAGKKSEATFWGELFSLICLSPELEPVFTTALLLAWSYSEAVCDLRTLFSGGKVPLMKSSGTWKTELFSIFSPGLSSGDRGEESGLDYTGYLRILLFLENGTMRDYRLMDLLEMDVRKAEHSESFRMDGCMDTFSVDVMVLGSSGQECSIHREGSYG